jgi:hypothetical protein
MMVDYTAERRKSERKNVSHHRPYNTEREEVLCEKEKLKI